MLWLERAAEGGSLKAVAERGRLYFALGRAEADGEKADELFEQGLSYYREAAAQGEEGIPFILGAELMRGVGKWADPFEGIQWFAKGAQGGDVESMAMLASVLAESGQSLEDPMVAEWLRTAAVAGSLLAMHTLGKNLAYGRGMAQSEGEAVGWFRKGAELGFVPSMGELGRLLIGGRGVPQDEDEGLRWCRRGAELGNDDAARCLADAGGQMQ
jgi:TPR repeat protein